jgi:hypothetical protein
MATADPGLRPSTDRRKTPRPPMQACTQCGHPTTRVVARTVRALYIQCDGCHHIHAVDNRWR